MERSRSAALPLPSALDELPDLGLAVAAAPLSERLDALRSVGRTREDVTFFVQGLALPLGGGETPRHRADVLLDVLEDEQLRGLTTPEGIRVGGEAMEALQALGFPYALEVTPAMLASVRESGTRTKWGADTFGGVGAALLSTLSLVLLPRIQLDARLCFGALLMAFTLAAVLSRDLGGRGPHRLFNVLQGLMAGPLLLLSGLAFTGVNSTRMGFITLSGALLSLVSAWLLRRGPSGDDPA